ncbi:hypothetical protein ZIOFF_017920 [Zingiber officinale]|uniref:Uncharacterized protein n=1 Tax=Zingiber officinale TaxID=94328 RepID=A0A8J5LLQ3_ZINOF|nr:hypothetical protein ZIOFF_017920 [Zingiber officinale]
MESSAIAAAGFLGQRVFALLQLEEKLKELVGIEARMENLKELSAIIDTVIQDVEACSVTDAALKNLLRKLKHLAYDLEDVVDYYDTEASRKERSRAYSRPVRDFFSSNNNQLVFKSRISGMMKAVTKNLDSILKQKSILENLRQGTNRISLSAYRGIHPHNNLDVKGRETEKEMIVNMLTADEGSSNDTMKVIAIVGMGGLGKTTLARHVFNDERVKSYFGNFRMWKVVGAEFDPTKIMKSVLELAATAIGAPVNTSEPGIIMKSNLQLATQALVNTSELERMKSILQLAKGAPVNTSELDLMRFILQSAKGAPANISEPELVRGELEKALSDKRFLLVLDDVWNEDALPWRELKEALSCGARGSKVLVTTRNQNVASIMGSFKTHHIQQLSRDDCFSLFQQFSFGDEEPNENLKKIGGKIVEKCAGVPLAAVSLGSALHSIRDETYWSSVLNSEVWQLRDEDQKFLAVLKLSYDALPLRSKKCFAFGSLFPKNYVMDKDELIQMWTTNGFVCSDRNFDAETLGKHIFDDLVLRSFFLLAPSEKCDDGFHVTKCTMHDLMHDLARSVSEDEYCNIKDNQTKNIQKRTYHLRIEYTKEKFSLFKKEKPFYLRTLLLRKCNLSGKVHLLQFIFSELKFLRALDLSENGIKGVPTSVGNSIHLRYLTLSKNKIKFLPDTITLLQNLLFLNLTENPLQELPKRLRYMQSLWYLYCDCDSLTHMPPGLSGLTSLRSLSSFVVENRTGSCSITQLEDLKLHGAMEIKFSKNFSSYSCGGRKIFMNKDFNELSLSFNCSTTNDMSMLDDLCPNKSLKKLKICNYGSRHFPTWLMESQLPNLVVVILQNCNFCEHIPHFRNLQFLRKLVIDGMSGVKHMVAECHGHGPIRGCPSLQEFKLISMTNLEGWSESDGVDELFPILKKLEIWNCPKLKNIPKLQTIELLKLHDCSGSLLSSVGRMTSLSHLKLEDVKGMTSLPSGCLRNLTSLMKLEIISCHELQFLPMDEMQQLTMVHSLFIQKCFNLRLQNCDSNTAQPEILVQILNSLHEFDIQICCKNGNLRGQLQHLHRLGQLSISGSHRICDPFMSSSIKANLSICCYDELESLMTEAPSTSVLEDLYICNIPKLMTLPEWLQHLGSLRGLCIYNCYQLESLPRSLQELRLLENLMIFKCHRQLKRRCKRVTGEDWPNISHKIYAVMQLYAVLQLYAVFH